MAIKTELRDAPPNYPGAVNFQRHVSYFWTFACFEAQGVLFQLPLLPFIQGSDAFANQYGLSADIGRDSLEDEVAIPRIIGLGVELLDFEAFLKALLPQMASPFSSTPPSLTKSEWISTLKLSTLWSFNSLRSIAINHLSNHLPTGPSQNPDTLTEFVHLARVYKVTSWLLTCYQALVQFISTCRALTLAEAEAIGHATAHELHGLALKRIHTQRDRRYPPPPASDEILTSLPIRSELDAFKEDERKYTVWGTSTAVAEGPPTQTQSYVYFDGRAATHRGADEEKTKSHWLSGWSKATGDLPMYVEP